MTKTKGIYAMTTTPVIEIDIADVLDDTIPTPAPRKPRLLTWLERTANFFKVISTTVQKGGAWVAKQAKRYTFKGKHRRKKTESVYAKSTVTDGIVVKTPTKRTPGAMIKRTIQHKRAVRAGAKEPALGEPARGVIPAIAVNTYYDLDEFYATLELYLTIKQIFADALHPDPTGDLPRIPAQDAETTLELVGATP